MTSKMNVLTNSMVFYTLSVLFLLGIILVGPWDIDEGWHLCWANNYLETGRFINDVGHNSEISFMKTFVAVLAAIGNFTDFSYFFARVPFFLISIATLFLLHKLLILLNIDSSYAIVSSLSLTIWFGYTMIVRPENIYMFSILFSVFSVVYYVKYKKSFILLLAILINALSFSIHPNGILGYLVLLIGFIMFFREVSQKDYIYIVSGIILGGIISYYSLLWYQSIDEFWLSYNRIKEDSVHTIPFYKEYLRYLYLFLSFELVIPIFILSFAGLFLKLRFWKESQKLERFLIISAIASLLYLFFLPVKWNYYFSVSVPIMVIFIAYLLQYFSHDRNHLSKILSVFLSFILIILFFKNFKQNEMFLETFQIPSQRLILLQKLKEQTQNAKVLLSPILFPYLRGEGRELFFSDEDVDQVDYVILGKEVTLYLKELASLKEKGFEYQFSFQFQGDNYSLFIRRKSDFLN